MKSIGGVTTISYHESLTWQCTRYCFGKAEILSAREMSFINLDQARCYGILSEVWQENSLSIKLTD